MSCVFSTSRARAFTLIEVLVVMGLGMLILGVIHHFLMFTYRNVARNSAQAEMQQFSTLAMYRLEKELQQCDQGGVSWEKTPTFAALGLHPVQEVTPTRHKKYRDQMAIYCWDVASGSFQRRTWGLGTLDIHQARRLTPAEFALIVFQPNGTVLCTSVVDFNLEMDGPPRYSQPLKLTMRLRRSVNSRDEVYRMERYVCLRNSL